MLFGFMSIHLGVFFCSFSAVVQMLFLLQHITFVFLFYLYSSLLPLSTTFLMLILSSFVLYFHLLSAFNDFLLSKRLSSALQ